MDTNRGAKGSIKDRIISMLYRMRYNKEKIKEEEYTVSKKKSQEEYLKKLKQFNETENLYVLDKKDQNKVRNIKITGFIEPDYEQKKINNNTALKSSNNSVKKVSTYTIINKPKGIGFKSVNIDLPKNADKVELKKEIKKTKEEINILSEVNTFIKKSKESLNNIENQVEEIKTNVKNKNQDFSKIEEKYNKLKKEIEKLKNQYDTVKSKYDLSEFKILESIKLMKSIENYKSLSSLNEIEMMVRVCKNEINSIKSIEVVNAKKIKTGETINSVKEEQNSVKVKFKKSSEKIKELYSLEDRIKTELEKQKDIVNEMYEKVSYIKEDVIKTKEYTGRTSILSSLFKITVGMLTSSLSKKRIFGFALGATLVNRGLKELNRSYEIKEKISVDIKYEDLTSSLNAVSDKLDYTNLVLTDSLNEIKKLKNNFINEYKNYSNILPNYEDSLKQIENLEINIKANQQKLQVIDQKLKFEKEENQKKLNKVLKIKQKY